jgi:hypothetical protein
VAALEHPRLAIQADSVERLKGWGRLAYGDGLHERLPTENFTDPSERALEAFGGN